MITVNFTFVIEIVLFLILMVVLNKLLFQPVLHVLDERRERIDGGRARAKELEEETQQKISEWEKRLQDARIAGASERNRIRAEGQQAVAALLETARKDSDAVLADMRARIAREQDDARAALHSEVTRLAQEVAGKVLGRTVA